MPLPAIAEDQCLSEGLTYAGPEESVIFEVEGFVFCFHFNPCSPLDNRQDVASRYGNKADKPPKYVPWSQRFFR